MEIPHPEGKRLLPPHWADKLGVPQIVADLLWRRGLESMADMDTFLSPGLRHLSPPDCWPGMAEAVDTLEKGIREGRRVLIWGDYDVDGITGATLILQTLRFHDVPASVHLPDRRKEGYGLNIPEIERLAAEEEPGILLTVDCGISDVRAVARARELGFTVVVSDHHMPPRLCRTPTRSPIRASTTTTPARIWPGWAWPSSSRARSTPALKPCPANAWICGACSIS
ncbi:MAG: DHH family phosphoesterase [Bilophila sp.]